MRGFKAIGPLLAIAAATGSMSLAAAAPEKGVEQQRIGSLYLRLKVVGGRIRRGCASRAALLARAAYPHRRAVHGCAGQAQRRAGAVQLSLRPLLGRL